MKNIKKFKILSLLLSLSLTLTASQTLKTSAQTSSDNLVIKGLVSNPLNLTYNQIKALPMLTENVSLQCVGLPKGKPFLWAGVPLFYLLNLAKLLPTAKEVVFRAEDDFSSSLTIEKVMHPTTILALEVNGTILPYEDGYFTGGLAGGYPYKVVVPCKYGYKWVGWVDEIEVVDYDYKGFYESMGFSDEADIPNCTSLPTTTPPYAELNVTWRDTYTLTTFTNVTILDAGFNETTKHIYFNILNAAENFVYAIIPKRLLTTDFTVLSDNVTMQYHVIQGEINSFLYFTVEQSVHRIEIKGMLLADVTGFAIGVPDGKVDMRDIGALAKRFGTMVGDPNYVAEYDITSDGTIDMKDIGIAAKDFGKTVF